MACGLVPMRSLACAVLLRAVQDVFCTSQRTAECLHDSCGQCRVNALCFFLLDDATPWMACTDLDPVAAREAVVERALAL